MAIAAEPSSPSGSPLAADREAVSVDAVLEMSITVTAIVASAAVAVAITKDNYHPRNGHDINDRLHDGYEDMVVDDGPPSLLFLSNNNKGNAFPTKHALSNAGTVATATTAVIVAAATDNQDDDNNNVRIHPPPQPRAAVSGNAVKVAGTIFKGVACCLSFLAPQRYLCMHILKDLNGH